MGVEQHSRGERDLLQDTDLHLREPLLDRQGVLGNGPQLSLDQSVQELPDEFAAGAVLLGTRSTLRSDANGLSGATLSNHGTKQIATHR